MAGYRFQADGLTFEIMDGNRIDKVRVSPPQIGNDGSGDGPG